jgi:hypothetical protein
MPALRSKADVAHLLTAGAVTPSEALVDVRELLAVHLDFTDNIDIRPMGLDYEKFAHNRWLKNNVGDIEIVGNHHQIRGVAVF